jgi:deoxyribodipyrimidine photolyase-related protein
MSEANLIFPHQLFAESPIAGNGRPVYLVEEFLFFKQYSFHKQKIAFHRASMRFYAEYLRSKGKSVIYVEAGEERADVRQLISALGKQGVQKLHYIDATDDWLEKRIISAAEKAGVEVVTQKAPGRIPGTPSSGGLCTYTAIFLRRIPGWACLSVLSTG